MFSLVTLDMLAVLAVPITLLTMLITLFYVLAAVLAAAVLAAAVLAAAVLAAAMLAAAMLAAAMLAAAVLTAAVRIARADAPVTKSLTTVAIPVSAF